MNVDAIQGYPLEQQHREALINQLSDLVAQLRSKKKHESLLNPICTV